MAIRSEDATRETESLTTKTKETIIAQQFWIKENKNKALIIWSLTGWRWPKIQWNAACWPYRWCQHNASFCMCGLELINSSHSLIRSEGIPCILHACLLLLLDRERYCFSSGRAPWSPSNLSLHAWRSHD